MTKRFLAIGGVVATLLATPPAAAQWPPDSLQNLQVLPETTSVTEIVGIMRGFASGLGVRCIHCHVGEDPNDLSTTNFVSDEKVEKRKAREMLRMVQTINNDLLAAIPERSDPPVEVTCSTCHHGVTKPIDIRAILAETATTHGVDSVIAQYEAMREQYYGSDSYDFSTFMLANVAEQIWRQAPDVAFAIIEYNLERYPADQQTFVTLAQIYQRMGDREALITTLERGIEAMPDNQFFKQMLDQVRGN